MKALTIRQPWASLIAFGEKKIETRSWKTSYRGQLLIHAGKKIEKCICDDEPFYSVLHSNGVDEFKKLPTGVIIAKANLVDCVKIEFPVYENGIYRPKLENGQTVDIHNEFYFGDYTQGRYAWILDDIEILKEPLPAKGKLSLWEFDYEEYK